MAQEEEEEERLAEREVAGFGCKLEMFHASILLTEAGRPAGKGGGAVSSSSSP